LNLNELDILDWAKIFMDIIYIHGLNKLILLLFKNSKKILGCNKLNLIGITKLYLSSQLHLVRPMFYSIIFSFYIDSKLSSNFFYINLKIQTQEILIDMPTLWNYCFMLICYNARIGALPEFGWKRRNHVGQWYYCNLSLKAWYTWFF
jgi:hypothetical protein